MSSDFAPSASLDTLRHRATLLGFTRRFFDSHGYLEVETPLLSPDVVVDAHLEPFSTRFRSDPASSAGQELFLQTSPEFSLKRLLAAGSGPVYEVFRAFRNGEAGRLHNPEFTLLEWYRPGDTHVEQMDFTEEYVRAFFREAAALVSIAPIRSPSPWGEGPGVRGVSTPPVFLATVPRSRCLDERFDRFTYDEAFERFAATRVLNLCVRALADLAASRGVSIPGGLSMDEDSRDLWLNLLLAELVEPHLGVERPAFLYDYPATQAALARIRRDDPPVAERFELYVGGIELCNGYHELLDPDELRRRNREQNVKRAALGLRTLPEESRLLAAMEHGLPPCSGVALGFDRLVMVALGRRTSLAEVRAFLTEDSGLRTQDSGH